MGCPLEHDGYCDMECRIWHRIVRDISHDMAAAAADHPRQPAWRRLLENINIKLDEKHPPLTTPSMVWPAHMPSIALH